MQDLSGTEAKLPKSMIAGTSDTANGNESSKDEKREIKRFVPYGRLADQAFESIHLNGQARFLCYDGKRITTMNEIIEADDDKTRRVLHPVTDFPYAPYNFTTNELSELPITTLDDAMGKAYDRIFKTISPFIDTDEQNLHIDSAAILFSYFQHKSKSTPYIYKLGAPEAGKTRSLRLAKWLAYRPIMAVSMTSANIYRYLGKDVDAAGTIIHDEAEKIHLSNEMMSIYNDGYTFGSKVPRITGEHQESQSYYFSYCMKFFSGMQLPKNNAFVSRCIVQHYMQGTPEKIDIEDEDEEHFRQVRKELLVLRLLKAFDRLPSVNTGLRGRSRELYAPLLAIVQGTDWYNTLLNPLLVFDEERRQSDRESKPGYLARSVIECWLSAAKEAFDLSDIPDLSKADPRLQKIAEPLFIPNESIVMNLNLEDKVNDKGRKILVSDNLPFILTRTELGTIQSENLKGKADIKRVDKKVVRGHWFDIKTVRQLHRRYAVTVVTAVTSSKKKDTGQSKLRDVNDTENASRIDQTFDNSNENDAKSLTNHSQEGLIPPVTAVTNVTSVTDMDHSNRPKQNYFRDIFKSLEKDNGTVSESTLKRELISSGKFDASQAHQIIQDNLKENTICEVNPFEYKLADDK